MAVLRRTNAKEVVTDNELMIPVPFFGQGGIRSSELVSCLFCALCALKIDTS